ncbi:MAG: hypothetical protein IIB39_03060 [Candidatus Marinimicrobia bacterium]|nr:hypothetical protein [Candidatus Neomarinimicrobiota bacterium]
MKTIHGNGVCAVPLLPKGFSRENFAEMTLHGGILGLNKIGAIRKFFTRENVLGESGFVSIDALLVAESNLVEVWVDTTEWNINVFQSDIDKLVNSFENETPSASINPNQGILAIEIQYLGSPPDIDGNGKVIILILDINDDYDAASNPAFVAGYFDQADQLIPSHLQASGNFGDLLYIDSNPGKLGSSLILSTAAHELQHLINYNYDTNEDPWLNEGLSEYATLLTGYSGRGFGRFLSQTNRGLLTWDNLIQDYSRVGLWVTYTAMRLGLDAIKMLVQDDSNGKLSAENVISTFLPGKSFSDYIYEWTIANLIDDISIKDGEFGYPDIDIPAPIPKNQYFTLPVTGMGETVHSYASVYHEFAGGEELGIFTSLKIPSSMKASVVSIKNTPVVNEIVINANGEGEIEVTGFGTEFNRSFLVISYLSDELDSANYFYSASGFGGFETVELSHDDGQLNFFIDSGNSSIATLFSGISSTTSLLSAKIFMGVDEPISLQVREDNVNAASIFEKTNIIPAVNGWTEVFFGSNDLTVTGPIAIVLSGDSLIIGYDSDTDGSGNAFREDSSGFFRPLSNFRTTDDQTLNGNWMIRLLVKQIIEVDKSQFFQTAIRGDDWLNFIYSNGAIAIPYTVSREANVKIYLYDVLGRTVRTWTDIGVKSPGKEHQLLWNGKNNSGHVQSTGLYFLRLDLEGETVVKKLTLIK